MAELNSLMVVAQESGLEKSKVEALLSNFAEPFNQAKTVIDIAKTINVTSEDQVNEMREAKEARIELKRIRVDVEKTRVKLKEQSLREGKAIDGMANVFKALVVPVEERLEKQEKFAERLAEERKARVFAERTALIEKYTDDATLYNYADISDEAFKSLVNQIKTAKEQAELAEKKAAEAEKARLEAEEKLRLENEAKAKAETERIRKENERLQAEAKARELAQAKLEAENAKKLAEERKKREQLEAQQLEAEKQKAKELAEAENLKKAALLAPDKEKLVKLADTIENILLPSVSNREAGKLLDETEDSLMRIGKNLRQKAKEL